MVLKKIVSKDNSQKLEPLSLKGIWKNKGFEKISNLENELKLARNEMIDSVLKKEN